MCADCFSRLRFCGLRNNICYFSHFKKLWLTLTSWHVGTQDFCLVAYCNCVSSTVFIMSLSHAKCQALPISRSTEYFTCTYCIFNTIYCNDKTEIIKSLTHDTTRPLKHGKCASSSLSSSFTTLQNNLSGIYFHQAWKRSPIFMYE